MEEIWKDVPEYENLYQVSNLGRVKSLERTIKTKKGVYQKFKERIKTTNSRNTKNGYLRVSLCKQGKQKTFLVHQLVAIAFLGHKINGMKYVVNHKDFNKLNNNASNLEIVSQRQNTNRKHLKSTSQFVGVSWNKLLKKWASQIVYNGKIEKLGYFDNELEAHFTYQTRLNEINRLNKAV